MLSRIALILCIIAIAPARADTDLPPRAQFPLTITTQNGDAHRFTIRIATSKQAQRRGLMFVQTMPDDEGMLFLFDTPRIAKFWMKNTYLPLDMIFVAPNGRILNIETRRDTNTTHISTSRGYAKAVLELNAGIAARLNIRAGDTLAHPLIIF